MFPNPKNPDLTQRALAISAGAAVSPVPRHRYRTPSVLPRCLATRQQSTTIRGDPGRDQMLAGMDRNSGHGVASTTTSL